MSKLIGPKVSDKLKAIKDEVEGRRPRTSVECLGRTFHLESLTPAEDSWVAAKTEGTTMAAILLNSRVPIIAAALRKIDDDDLEVLFTPGDDLDDDLKKDREFMRAWRRDQLLSWIRGGGLEEHHIQTLYKAYDDMQATHKSVLKEIGSNLANRTPSSV